MRGDRCTLLLEVKKVMVMGEDGGENMNRDDG
jgi:hypothetical protein